MLTAACWSRCAARPGSASSALPIATTGKPFGSHASIINQWTDANERDFKYRLAALDGARTKKTEAA